MRTFSFAALVLFFSVFNLGCMRMAPGVAQAQAGGGTTSGPIRITNFDECVAGGYSVVRSFPPKCVTPNGMEFVKQRAAPAGANCENMCGDGTCQQIVCQAVGCPCAETPVNCAADCASSGF
jgi:hypothetical protein